MTNRRVKRAFFQNEVVAGDFAVACRKVGMKAAVVSVYRDNGMIMARGFCVKWAPSWDYFIHE